MPQTPRRTIVIDGKKVEVIEPEDIEPEWNGPPPNPSWKNLKTALILRDLPEVTQSFRDNLNLIRSEISPKAATTIRWYLKCIDEILRDYDFYHGEDSPPGRPPKQLERLIAKRVVLEFQKVQGDATKFPTGNYLYEKMTLINEERISKGEKEFSVSEKSCDNWISEMRKGTFDPPRVDYFF